MRIKVVDSPILAEARIAYIVQGRRFYILEQVGCFPSTVNTLPTYFLVAMWPILIGIISAIYCGKTALLPFAIRPPLIPTTGLTLWSFLQRQAQFSQFMSSNSTLTMSRYFRLMALAGVELLCTTPLSVFLMVLDATSEPVVPWISWDDTHYDFSNPRLIPAAVWNMDHWAVVGIQFNRWSGPLCAFVFFAFFGFASEARKNYYKAISKVLVACRLKRDPSLQRASSGSVALFYFDTHLLMLLPSAFVSSLSRPLPQCPMHSPYTCPPHPPTNLLVLRQPRPPLTTRVSCLSYLQEPAQNLRYPLVKSRSSRNLGHHKYSPTHHHREHRRRRWLTASSDFPSIFLIRSIVSLALHRVSTSKFQPRRDSSTRRRAHEVYIYYNFCSSQSAGYLRNCLLFFLARFSLFYHISAYFETARCSSTEPPLTLSLSVYLYVRNNN